MNSPTLSTRGILDEAIDVGYLRTIVERLAATGSSAMGFRLAGTPEEVELSGWIAEQMTALGLAGVALEPVPVDAWRFQGARVEALGRVFECASFGGSPATPPEGVAAEVVFVGRGTRDEAEAADLDGRIALIDWRGGDLLWPSMAAAEAARAGARAALITSLPGGAFYQREGALGAFDTYGLPGAIPLITVRKEDALELIAAGTPMARVTLDAEHRARRHRLQRRRHAARAGATGPRSSSPAITTRGSTARWTTRRASPRRLRWPRRCATRATSRTGRSCSARTPPRSSGSRRTVRLLHRRRLADPARAPGVGARRGALPQHRGHRHAAAAADRGAGRSWRASRPRCATRPPRTVCCPTASIRGAPRPWTEAWPFLAAGVPAINVNSHHLEFFRTEYHTQYDDPASSTTTTSAS